MQQPVSEREARDQMIGASHVDGVLEAHGISMVFRREDSSLEALHNIDLSIGAGEFVALVGPSGCGKSTLLRIFGGLLQPTAGTVRIHGAPIIAPRRDVGLMFQKSTLFEWRTALANVLLPVEVARRSKPPDVAQAQELLRLVHLDAFKDHYPRELSGGMQQRVALARLLMLDPEVMLLDEPFGALDEFTREALNQELAAIVARDQRTGILVTHNVTEAVFLADRVIAMASGPGRIVGDIAVTTPRPRSISFMQSTECRDATVATRHALGLQ